MRYLRKVAKGDESDLNPTAVGTKWNSHVRITAEVLTRCFQIEEMPLLSI